ncbi:TolC family protein [Maribellus sediminis]|uniref:TolC family protein n=1 Tax=Maribellus sediminis TaxID=2696285 RepID=UPI001431E211|nr:TolC family protein [Maribellus sediminis]
MKKLIYIISSLLILATMPTKAQDELNTYLVTAAENNPGLKAKFDDYMAALEVAPQVSALPDPQLAFGYFIQPVETRMGPQRFKVSLTQMFPWFGTLNARENVAVQAAKVKYELFEEAKSQLFNDVRGTYFNLYFTQKAIDITGENLEILSAFQKLAVAKIEAGLVSTVDEYRIEMETGELENQLALLKDKMRSQTVLFNQMLNDTLDTPVKLPNDLWANDLEFSKVAILDSIRAQNHQLLKLELERELFSLKQEVARKQGSPSISVGFDYINVGKGEMNLEGKDAFMFPRIGLSIPLYRNKYNSMVKEVVLQESAKTFEMQNKDNMLEAIFEAAYTEYMDANRRIELYNMQLTLAQRSLNIMETEYATSGKNFEELLRMERKLLKYALELEKAKTDKQAAISNIKYLMGK